MVGLELFSGILGLVGGRLKWGFRAAFLGLLVGSLMIFLGGFRRCFGFVSATLSGGFLGWLW